MRLFTAVNFSEPIKDSMCGVIEKLHSQGVQGDFSKRDNLHLTLVFLGETSRISQIRSAIDSLNSNAFKLTLDKIGTFKRDGGDILWFGTASDNNLTVLHKQLYDALTEFGFDIDTRAFKPHLTLGRQMQLPKNFIIPSLPPLTADVNAVSLMKSEHINSRLIYTELYRHNLNLNKL